MSAATAVEASPDDRQGKVDDVEVEDREEGTGKEDGQSKPATRVSETCVAAADISRLSGARTQYLSKRPHGHRSFPLGGEVRDERRVGGQDTIDAFEARMQGEEKE